MKTYTLILSFALACLACDQPSLESDPRGSLISSSTDSDDGDPGGWCCDCYAPNISYCEIEISHQECAAFDDVVWCDPDVDSCACD